MPLLEIAPPTLAEMPRDVAAFLAEADRRIEEFQSASRIFGFVPGDYRTSYVVLSGLARTSLHRGPLIVEWGSGFGVNTILAAMCGFEAYGIEIEGRLVDASRQLADDFGVAATFVAGSYIPRRGQASVDREGGCAWLHAQADNTYEELGFDPEDVDVVFAYPWPDEEAIATRLFERFAGDGALLLSFHGDNGFRLRRQVSRRKQRH